MISLWCRYIITYLAIILTLELCPSPDKMSSICEYTIVVNLIEIGKVEILSEMKIVENLYEIGKVEILSEIEKVEI